MDMGNDTGAGAGGRATTSPRGSSYGFDEASGAVSASASEVQLPPPLRAVRVSMPCLEAASVPEPLQVSGHMATGEGARAGAGPLVCSACVDVLRSVFVCS